MSIVTISRGSYSKGKEVAEKLAEKLNYECVSREIILEACNEFNIPELQLVRALHDAPSVLERFQHGRERFLCYFNYALLKHVQKGNVIYHGLAGHYHLKGLNDVLKVRIVADIDARVQEEMKRENITEKEALYQLRKDDDERRKWGTQVHGTDTWDSRLYDMVFHIGQLTVEDVVEIIDTVLQKETFNPTASSQKKLDEMVLAARVQTMVVKNSPMADVKVENGNVYLSRLSDTIKADKKLKRNIEDSIADLDGVSTITFCEPFASKSNYINPFHNI